MGSRALFEFDRELGVDLVAGADEVGRGSLAGPLVAAAVLFDYSQPGAERFSGLAELNDSKAHTFASREALYTPIIKAARCAAIAVCSVAAIDADGLHVSNLAALREALMAVATDDCICLVDGYAVPEFGCVQRTVIGGDRTSAAVAAASVIAKVSRDRFMRRADALYPGWDFAANVGYSTEPHRAAIAARGICELHRRSFNSVAYQQLKLGQST